MKKLSLVNLRVTSFVTELKSHEKQTVHGGIEIELREPTYGCPSNGVSCLPPKSKGCFSEGPGQCTMDVEFG
ncbi:pinensin family lanthipeptide [Fulvivirga sp. 29W222]|uniref:Pinensin family lanthipeptide n=1 Tax=Fulvivirga marina TaxID=2494733 RepID=A0A937G3E4_9BACT|nr:pinensin family lanthipeptide [Fulvivirga marina]MBL6449967.1 pinensin family lanthipeptide [Fulvivirga marina]